MERGKKVKKVGIDYRLIIGFTIAHILMYLTFQDTKDILVYVYRYDVDINKLFYLE